jgi:hypothetical protein
MLGPSEEIPYRFGVTPCHTVTGLHLALCRAPPRSGVHHRAVSASFRLSQNVQGERRRGVLEVAARREAAKLRRAPRPQTGVLQHRAAVILGYVR